MITPSPSIPSSQGPTLVFRRGPFRGKVLPLDKERVSFGRDPGNDVPIVDDTISSFHAAVLREGSGVHWLEDIGSKNGTYLNGERIQRARLEDGDRFSLCQSGPEIQFVFRASGDDVEFDSTRTACAGRGSLPHDEFVARKKAGRWILLAGGILPLVLTAFLFYVCARPERRRVTLIPRLEPIYGSLFLSYRESPIGEVEVKNEGNHALMGCDLQLRFLREAANFLVEPWSLPVPKVGPQETVVLQLTPKLSVEILADQTREVTATVSLVRGEEVLAESSRAVFVHGRHVFSWERPERLAAFVDPDDPALQSFVQTVWECRPETGKHEFPPPNVVSALTLLTGLADAGLHYLPDAADPISERVDANAVDNLKYPGETLLTRSGDCDDLSVLSSAVLEAVHIPTAFAVGAGHVFILFDSGVEAKDMSESPFEASTVISWRGKVWVPVEPTDFARPGSSFLSAWAAAWPRCTSATTDALKIVETEEAWRKYQPMNPPPDEATRDRIASTRWTGGETAGHVRAGLQSFQKLFEANLAKRVGEMEKALGDGPERDDAVGLLYAKSGLFEEARRAFEKALLGGGKQSPGPGLTRESKAALLSHLALCLTLGAHSPSDLESAAKYSEMAIGCLDEDAREEKGEMMLRLALVQRLRGDLAAEKSWSSRAFGFDPALEATYQKLVASEGPVSGPDEKLLCFLRRSLH